MLLHCLGKYTALECFLKGNDCNLEAFWNGAVFYSKHQYLEESFVHYCCFSKQTILEVCEKGNFANYKHVRGLTSVKEPVYYKHIRTSAVFYSDKCKQSK